MKEKKFKLAHDKLLRLIDFLTLWLVLQIARAMQRKHNALMIASDHRIKVPLRCRFDMVVTQYQQLNSLSKLILHRVISQPRTMSPRSYT